MSDIPGDTSYAAFFALHDGLPRQAPGSDATTRELLRLAGPLPERARVLDLGCGPGRATLVLAATADLRITAVDLHQPFLDQLDAEAARLRLTDSIETVNQSMDDLLYPDGSFDLIWAEGSAYILGFDAALTGWRRLLAPGGVMVLTECEWVTDEPSAQARAFWDAQYPLRSTAQNVAAAEAAGYGIVATLPVPDSDWFDEYYTPLAARLDAADTADPGMATAVAMSWEEIVLRREHGADYRYMGYVLRPE